MKTAAIYARVSPTKHIKTVDGLHQSLDEAIKMCKEDAEREGYTVVATYVDQYISGKSSKTLPDFNRMMDDARTGKNTAERGDHKTQWNRIYCRRVNRFGRNRADMIQAEIELTNLDITLKFVELGIDTRVLMGKSMMALLAELAEEDRKEIIENTKRGRKDAMMRGVKFGRKKKEIDVKSLRKVRLMPVNERPNWKKCEVMFGACTTVLINALKDAEFWDYEKRTVK